MKNNNKYEAPKATIVSLEAVEVITSSVFLDSDILPDGWLEA